MALIKINRATQSYSGTPEYVGRVLDIYSQIDQVMSDVWETMLYAVVLLDDGSTRNIALGGTWDFNYEYHAEVDADPQTIADWKARVEATIEAKRKADAEERAKKYETECMQSAKAPTKGRTVTVVKGRKVPIGTTGMVVWEGIDSYGANRIGIKDASGHVHYTAASNATANVTKPDGMTWSKFVEGLRNSRPVRDAGVKILATGQVGICFFAQDERVGIALTSRKVQGRYMDVLWANVDEVVRVEGIVTLPPGDPEVKPAPVVQDIVDVPF